MSDQSRAQAHVAGIFVSPEAGAPMRALDAVEAVAGQGLEGDRYQAGEGFMSQRQGGGLELTLVETEALAELSAENGIDILPADSRRNIATRGIHLNDLVDRDFQIGGAVCRGVRLCEPCARIEKLVCKPFVKPMVHRAGLRADILTSGTIRIGDAIQVLTGPSPTDSQPSSTSTTT
jgi:MOSC domain-containing protein YiiM